MGKKNNNIEDAVNSKFSDEDKFDNMDSSKLDDSYYQTSSALDFAPELIESFDERGYRLKWVRMREGKDYDTKSLRKRLSPMEGYTFVSPSEVDPSLLISLGDVEQHGSSEVITYGDLVLMKVRREKAEARRKFCVDKASDQQFAIEERMRRNQIDGGSKTVTRTGKHAHFMG